MCACSPARTQMHAYLPHVCNKCVRMPLHVHSTSVNVHMQTCVCIHACACTRTHMSGWMCVRKRVYASPRLCGCAYTRGVRGAPRAACPPRLGGEGGHKQVGCSGAAGLLGVGAPQCSGQPGPPFYPPSPAVGLGSAASGCARVINHVAGVHARTHGRRRSQGLLRAAPHAPLFPGTHPPCPASSPTPLEISSCFPPFPLHPFALKSSELVSRRGSRQKELQRGCFPQPAAIDK